MNRLFAKIENRKPTHNKYIPMEKWEEFALANADQIKLTKDF